MPGNNFSEFIVSFNDFVIVKHHYLVGVTSVTLPFVATYWVLFSLVFIIIMTQFEHPFAGQEYGVAKWGNAIAFTKEFAAEDNKDNIDKYNNKSLLIGLLGGVGLTVLTVLLIVFINNKVKSRKN